MKAVNGHKHRLRKWSPLMAGAAGMLLSGFSGVALAAAPPAASPETFSVLVGGSSPHGNISTYNYYPDVVTVDAGDTITWHEGLGVHTVMIAGPGVTLPPPGSPPSLKPAGGSTFNGTGLDSSGLLMPGQSYSLTFTKPGIYTYQCGVHPDMVGAVVVQKAGAVRPMTPAQVQAASVSQLQADLNAGEQAKASAKLTTSPGPNGTTVYHVWTDLPSPTHWTVPLTSATGAQTGDAQLSFDNAGNLTVALSLTGKAQTHYSADIQVASAAAGAPVAHRLTGLTTSTSGAGTSTTTIPKVMTIPGNIWFVDIMNGSQVVASGQVNYPQYGALRYFPSNLTIHAGDSVIWKQNDFHEAHTVTFLAPGQTVQQADRYMTTKEGGNVVNGPGFFNSGFMWKGQTYQLTFDKPGVYHYQCLLHNVEGMLGTVTVLPASVSTPSSQSVTSGHYTVRTGDSLWSIALKQLGNGALWRSIYQANVSTIGPNPNALRVGEVLVIPSK